MAAPSVEAMLRSTGGNTGGGGGASNASNPDGSQPTISDSLNNVVRLAHRLDALKAARAKAVGDESGAGSITRQQQQQQQHQQVRTATAKSSNDWAGLRAASRVIGSQSDLISGDFGGSQSPSPARIGEEQYI